MMKRLTITIGLPASGKSTWAESVRANDPSRVRVVTRDDIRAIFHASFEQGDEPVVVKLRDEAIRGFLDKGYHVICADTNLDRKTQKRLASLAEYTGAVFETKDFRDVDLQTCLARNTYRHTMGDMKVPHEAIVHMYERYVKPLTNS